MARIDVIMPQMGESITEGTMSKWLKQVGDPVKRDEPIFEISTDKVDAEIPAATAGVLAEVLVTEGQTVAVGTIVARLETDVNAAVAAAPAAPAPPPTAPPAAVAPTAAAPATAPPPAAPSAAAAPTPTAPPITAPPITAPPPTAPPVSPAPGGDESAEERLRRKSTPLVRKMAEEHGIDLGAVAGTGSAGRVTKSDMQSYIEGGAPITAPPITAPPTSAAPPLAAPITAPPTTVPVAATIEAWTGDRVEPWSRIRKLTAAHMVMSRKVSAHVNSLIEIDYTHVGNIRKRLKNEYAERGVKLTYLSFVLKAIASNLRKHPVINAAVSGDNTIFRRDINIGIAVALDWGLIVPVVKNADDLSLLGIARAVQDLAERAREKRLVPDDIQRGTFTITNPGGFGTWVGTPVINQPQVAILAVGAIEKRPSVITLPDGSDTLGIRTKGMWCLAFDHRIVDGADADRFLADVRATMHDFPEETQS